MQGLLLIKKVYFTIVCVCKELNSFLKNFVFISNISTNLDIRRFATFKPILLWKTRLQGQTSQFDKYLTSIVSEQLLLCLDD